MDGTAPAVPRLPRCEEGTAGMQTIPARLVKENGRRKILSYSGQPAQARS